MRVLKPVEFTVTEDPETKMVQIEKPGLFSAHGKWEQRKDYDRQVHLRLYITKSKSFQWDYSPAIWAHDCRRMQQGAVHIGAGQTRAGQIYYFYGYQDRFYVSEIEIELSDIPLLIGRETQTKKERLQKEIDRIKAMAEAEGGVRVPIPDDVQILVWNRDGGKCVKCGTQELLEFDHIIPLSKGGSNSARNIQLLCQNCNRTKQNKIGG
jgi:HNH endonuclease